MKINIGAINALYPTPVVLAGTIRDGRANFITIAHIGIITHSLISLSIGKVHYSNAGILENKAFSVNIPSRDLVAETDYIGIVTGKNTDKSAIFDVFYGTLGTAPLIKQCPVNMECRLERAMDFGSHDLFIGEIVATHVDEEVLNDGKIDISKVHPLLFDMPLKKYWDLGGRVADCWNIGKSLKKKD